MAHTLSYSIAMGITVSGIYAFMIVEGRTLALIFGDWNRLKGNGPCAAVARFNYCIPRIRIIWKSGIREGVNLIYMGGAWLMVVIDDARCWVAQIRPWVGNLYRIASRLRYI
jgi:hypothetical protein